MSRTLSLIILFFGILYATAHNLDGNGTECDEINSRNGQNLILTQLTVEPEKDTRKTMTDARSQGEEVSQGRTFAIKRLQFMLLPVMYKMGVMTTLLTVLLIVSLKSLLIGVILLVLKVSSFLAKFHQPHAEPHHQMPWYMPPQPWMQPQPIHVHVSPSGDGGHHSHPTHDQVYSGWDRSPPTGPYGPSIPVDYGQYYFKG
ncbi:uncharacterized protein LOC124304830 [Neodiprion virginianus]|uniref:uncharacterized protein LOC124182496 n=1 Tax=Neodiprion fabricii TaxID=2872261 RepID=UPI001ED98430|nr:uncharacterized protein LOC124182496 [Neodiprion fabricii]XP_046619470.1 uncharacterized protein LOC124304830 [Neodiprion virginianus]